MGNYSLDYMVSVYCAVVSDDIRKERILEMVEENFAFKASFERNMNSFLGNYFLMRQAEEAHNYNAAEELDEDILEIGKEAKKDVSFYAEYSTISSIKSRFSPKKFD